MGQRSGLKTVILKGADIPLLLGLMKALQQLNLKGVSAGTPGSLVKRPLIVKTLVPFTLFN